MKTFLIKAHNLFTWIYDKLWSDPLNENICKYALISVGGILIIYVIIR